MKTLKKWEKSVLNLEDYMPIPCEIDEELYLYLGEIVAPQYCGCGFVQLGECEREDKFGTRYFMPASIVEGKYYYIGILPEFKQ